MCYNNENKSLMEDYAVFKKVKLNYVSAIEPRKEAEETISISNGYLDKLYCAMAKRCEENTGRIIAGNAKAEERGSIYYNGGPTRVRSLKKEIEK